MIPTLSALVFCLAGVALIRQKHLNLLPLQVQAKPGLPTHLLSQRGWRRWIFFGTICVPSALITWQLMAAEGAVLASLLMGAPFYYAAFLMAVSGWHLPLLQRMEWNALVLEKRLARLKADGDVAIALGIYPLAINYAEAMAVLQPTLYLDSIPSNELKIHLYERAHALAEGFSGHCRVAGQGSLSAKVVSATAEREAARLAGILKTLRAEDAALAAELLDVDRPATTNSDHAPSGPPAA